MVREGYLKRYYYGDKSVLQTIKRLGDEDEVSKDNPYLRALALWRIFWCSFRGLFWGKGIKSRSCPKSLGVKAYSSHVTKNRPYIGQF
jgi:hypothetical protein